MSPRRTVVIIIAVAIAGVAAAVNVLYLNSVQDRANHRAQLLQVYMVAHDVPKGTTGEDAISKGYVAPGAIPAQYRPATALSSEDLIRGKVALTDLAAGQVLVDGMFVEPRVAQVTFSQRIPANQVAVSVSFDSVHSVDNLLVPGDKVDMIVTLPNASKAGPTEQFLFQNVNIIAIGQNAAPQAGETQTVTNPGTGVITFAVPPIAAEKIVLAEQMGGIYLTLVPPDNQPTPIPPVDPTSLLSGGLTPYQ